MSTYDHVSCVRGFPSYRVVDQYCRVMYCSNEEHPGKFLKLPSYTAWSQAVPKAALQVDGKRK
jgi:hypothetical protein